jgi:hypothetical protein
VTPSEAYLYVLRSMTKIIHDKTLNGFYKTDEEFDADLDVHQELATLSVKVYKVLLSK